MSHHVCCFISHQAVILFVDIKVDSVTNEHVTLTADVAAAAAAAVVLGAGVGVSAGGWQSEGSVRPLFHPTAPGTVLKLKLPKPTPGLPVVHNGLVSKHL